MAVRYSIPYTFVPLADGEKVVRWQDIDGATQEAILTALGSLTQDQLTALGITQSSDGGGGGSLSKTQILSILGTLSDSERQALGITDGLSSDDQTKLNNSLRDIDIDSQGVVKTFDNTTTGSTDADISEEFNLPALLRNVFASFTDFSELRSQVGQLVGRLSSPILDWLHEAFLKIQFPHTQISRVTEDTEFGSNYFDYRSGSENYLSSGVSYDDSSQTISGLATTRKKIIGLTSDGGFGSLVGIKDGSGNDVPIIRTEADLVLRVNSTGLRNPTYANLNSATSTSITIASGDHLLIEVLPHPTDSSLIRIEVDILRADGTILELNAANIPHNNFNWDTIEFRHWSVIKGMDLQNYVGHPARRGLLAHTTDKWAYAKALLITSVLEGVNLDSKLSVQGNDISNPITDISVSGTSLVGTKADGSEVNQTLPSGGGSTGGLTAVSSDDTLSGTGTNDDPLKVSNPFTAEDETKLDGVEAGAEVNETKPELLTKLGTLSESEQTGLGISSGGASGVFGTPNIVDLGGGARGYAIGTFRTNADSVNPSTTNKTSNLNLRLRDVKVSAIYTSRTIANPTTDRSLIILDSVPADTSDLGDWRYFTETSFAGDIGSKPYFFRSNYSIGAVGDSFDSLFKELGIVQGGSEDPPEKATAQEVTAGTDNEKFVTPLTLQQKVNSIDVPEAFDDSLLQGRIEEVENKTEDVTFEVTGLDDVPSDEDVRIWGGSRVISTLQSREPASRDVTYTLSGSIRTIVISIPIGVSVSDYVIERVSGETVEASFYESDLIEIQGGRLASDTKVYTSRSTFESDLRDLLEAHNPQYRLISPRVNIFNGIQIDLRDETFTPVNPSSTNLPFDAIEFNGILYVIDFDSITDRNLVFTPALPLGINSVIDIDTDAPASVRFRRSDGTFIDLIPALRPTYAVGSFMGGSVVFNEVDITTGDYRVRKATDIAFTTQHKLGSTPLAQVQSLVDAGGGGSTTPLTDAEIKTQYENNADTNAFTDAEKTKLAGIEEGAEVNDTKPEILTKLGTLSDSEQTGLGISSGGGSTGINFDTNITATITSRGVSTSESDLVTLTLPSGRTLNDYIDIQLQLTHASVANQDGHDFFVTIPLRSVIASNSSNVLVPLVTRGAAAYAVRIDANNYSGSETSLVFDLQDINSANDPADPDISEVTAIVGIRYS